MGVFRAKLLVLLTAGLISAVSGKKCCLPGQLLTETDDEQYECQDISRGEMSPISLSCKVMLAERKDLEFIVDDDGWLQFILPNREVSYKPDKFCEEILNDTEIALICEEPQRMIDDEVYGYCMIISVTFLIATAARYATGAVHRTILSKSIISLCVSLAFGLFILAVMKLMTYTDMNWCAVRGFSAYYFVLVSFFWMNVISIHIMMSRKHCDSPVKEDKKHFLFYSVYAWGVPAVFTFITAIINFLPGDHLKPGIGLNHCWFFNVTQQWQYMYSIMFVLTMVNIIIFTAVTVTVCCSSRAHSESFKQKFATCVQLFVVMGIPWLFEMISSISSVHLAWEIIDLFNSLQGLWIFLVIALFPLKEKPTDTEQYKINIISADNLPYSKLQKQISTVS